MSLPEKTIKGAVLLFFFMLLFGCQPTQGTMELKRWKDPNGHVKVLTTIAMIHDLVSEIGGEYVDSIPLIQGNLDPHSYELVKGDDEKFLRADLIFYNGLGLEHGASLRHNLEKNLKAIPVGDTLVFDGKNILEVDGQYDPHIWMDITLWARMIDPITAGLIQKDPGHQEFYLRNGEKLRRKMEELDLRAFELLHAIPPQKRYLVTTHDAFNYFTRRYLAEPGEPDWQKRCMAPEGLAPESQLSVTDLISILKHIEEHKIRVLFSESNLNQDSLKKLVLASREKGILLRLCQDPLHADAMGNASSYLEMMEHNIAVIARELSQ